MVWTRSLVSQGLGSLPINDVIPLPSLLWAAETLSPQASRTVYEGLPFSSHPQRFPFSSHLPMAAPDPTQYMRSFPFHLVTEKKCLKGPLSARPGARIAASPVASVQTTGCKLGEPFFQNQHIFV